MHPRTTYGHAVAAAGAFTGVCALAVTTGLIFSRFAQPRARILFAHAPVLAHFEGGPTLMIRFANQRHKMVHRRTRQALAFQGRTLAGGDALSPLSSPCARPR
ncbi:MAG: hypothetical protein ACR650_10535 [Methylocystis sp.]